jgi:hypothetical protein
VWGVGCGVWGLGCRVWGLGFGVQGLGFRVWGVGFGVNREDSAGEGNHREFRPDLFSFDLV